MVTKAWLRRHRGSLLAVGLTLVVGMISAVWLSPDAWGALGQWAGALGTVLAVTVALRISQRKVDLEAERRLLEKAERELDQARLVVAVIECPSPETSDRLLQSMGMEPPDYVRITNFSATHIFHPRVEGFVHQNGGTVAWNVEGDFSSNYEGPPTVLSSGESDVVPVSCRFSPPITEDMWPMRTKVVIGYADAEGRRWRGVGLATPERVRADDAFPTGGPDWYRAEG